MNLIQIDFFSEKLKLSLHNQLEGKQTEYYIRIGGIKKLHTTSRIIVIESRNWSKLYVECWNSNFFIVTYLIVFGLPSREF